MKKILLVLSSAMLLFAACGKDDDEDSKDSKEISYVKTFTHTDSEGDTETIAFTYENNKLKNITDFYGEDAYVSEFNYTSDNSIKMVNNDGGESIITLDPSTKTISKVESSYYEDVYTTSYTYNDGFLASSIYDDEDSESYTWSNSNLTKIEKMYDGKVDRTITIAYSDIDNNTNLDFALWMMSGDPSAIAQFIKNISKKIPSSIKYGDRDDAPISTSLDEKGRPTKMTLNGETYTFEYYD